MQIKVNEPTFVGFCVFFSKATLLTLHMAFSRESEQHFESILYTASQEGRDNQNEANFFSCQTILVFPPFKGAASCIKICNIYPILSSSCQAFTLAGSSIWQAVSGLGS